MTAASLHIGELINAEKHRLLGRDWNDWLEAEQGLSRDVCVGCGPLHAPVLCPELGGES